MRGKEEEKHSLENRRWRNTWTKLECGKKKTPVHASERNPWAFKIGEVKKDEKEEFSSKGNYEDHFRSNSHSLTITLKSNPNCMVNQWSKIGSFTMNGWDCMM